MFRTYNGDIKKINKYNFKNEKEYYTYFLKQKYNVVIKNDCSIESKIINKIASKYKLH